MRSEQIYLYEEMDSNFPSFERPNEAPYIFTDPLDGILPRISSLQSSYSMTQQKLIQETTTMDVEDGDGTSAKHHTKDCLKVGRRLIKLVLKHLKTRSKLINKFLGASAKIVNSIFAVFGFKEPEIEELLKVEAHILQKTWEEFKNCLSYNKNKKICVVKSEYWNVMFCSKTFVGYALTACKNLEKSFIKDALFSFEGLASCLCEILFLTNQLLLLTLIFKDQTAKGGNFLRTVQTMGNLVVLMIEPSLFDFYNHRSGKFPNECCGRCKICCSKNLPFDLEIVLQRGREKASTLTKAIFEICPESLETVNDEQLFSILVLLVKQ